ncbi:MAG TPA: hypothetical protein VMW56_19965, partial [Candidatus Margulisiibacteriota bacterium]|nr:hypothetical protein [Candidatus Margulisiibacteriota bacterium]
ADEYRRLREAEALTGAALNGNDLNGAPSMSPNSPLQATAKSAPRLSATTLVSFCLEIIFGRCFQG